MLGTAFWGLQKDSRGFLKGGFIETPTILEEIEGEECEPISLPLCTVVSTSPSPLPPFLHLQTYLIA